MLRTREGFVCKHTKIRFKLRAGVPGAVFGEKVSARVDIAPGATQPRLSVVEKRAPSARIRDLLEPRGI
jgi:hypothetical protein